ncbi:MAG: hypothetical protein KGJ23_10010 [Euryarchaeota archaeon]|nr:hypothetical protein [Euryarchaeota archaeon]MDE1836938.1 hypothetical protein [Euryarchaeota archaeon]MDE1881899.1 hypothetical protein [Euryarchaeota archaeon]
MIRTRRELIASRRALRRLEHALEGTRQEMADDPEGFAFMKSQLDDLMRPIRRDLRVYEARLRAVQGPGTRPAVGVLLAPLRAGKTRV